MIGIDDIKLYLDGKGYEYEYSGNPSLIVNGYCTLSDIRYGCITWARKIEQLNGNVINLLKDNLLITEITTQDIKLNSKCGYIKCLYPKTIFFDLVEHYFISKKNPIISNTSVVETLKIGSEFSIGHFCHICKDVSIGNKVKIHDHVIIECPTTIGDGTEIYSGVVIGSDGFGYYVGLDGKQHLVPHTGGVTIGCDVSIGANTCIDRGTIGNTFIGDRVKIDNLCHIAHNVQIANDAMIIALSMLGGSCTLGEKAYIAPGVMIKDQIKIGENSLVGMGAVVIKNVEPCKIVAGVPATILRDNL